MNAYEPFLINPRRFRKLRRKAKRYISRKAGVKNMAKRRKVKRTKKSKLSRIMKRAQELKAKGMSMKLAMKSAWKGNPANSWKGEVKKHAKAARKGWRKHKYNKNPIGGELMLINPFKVKNLFGVNLGEVLQLTGGALIGFVGAKVIPNAVLPISFRSGTLKYVGQIGSAVVLSVIAGKVLKKKALANNIIAGGILAVAVDVVSGMLPMGAVIRPNELSGIRNSAGALKSANMGAIIPSAPIRLPSESLGGYVQ